jgi:hypothetical protein
MYQTYGQIYQGQNPKYTSRQTYLTDIQPCSKNIPVGSIVCPDYLPSCRPDSVNNSTNNTLDCRPRFSPANWPYRSNLKYFYDEPLILSTDNSKYNWIKESYVNSRLNQPYNSCKTAPYTKNLNPYSNLYDLYNPKLLPK